MIERKIRVTSKERQKDLGRDGKQRDDSESKREK